LTEVSYGLVVEGKYDKAIVPALLQKIMPSAVIFPISADGKSKMYKDLAKFMEIFQGARGGRGVDKVLVVQDCDQRPVELVESRLTERLPSWVSCFPRGVQVCGVRQAIEAWLMADPRAINEVARRRGVRGKEVGEVKKNIEEIVNPKGEFRKMLSQVGLEYTPPVAGEIASRIDLDRLRSRCPSFGSFERKVKDC
jgi:hypothetical protein